MIVHACNPSYLRDGGRKIIVHGWPRQKHKILSGKQTKVKTIGGGPDSSGVQDPDFKTQYYQKRSLRGVEVRETSSSGTLEYSRLQIPGEETF
jgi:hypothetical protein